MPDDNSEKRHDTLYIDSNSPSIGSAVGASARIIAGSIADRGYIREWWHNILREHGRYPCFAIFLALPSDEEAIEYFQRYGEELNLISNKNCLIIALINSEIKSQDFNAHVWWYFVDEQVSNGYSLEIAKLFEINLLQFPCILFFRDIRSSEYVLISLKNKTTLEIATEMRKMFSSMQEAVDNKRDILSELKKLKNLQMLDYTSKQAGAVASSLIKKTFETAMEVWIKSIAG